MTHETGSDFENYANFKFDASGKNPDLPFRNLEDIRNHDKHSGFFSTAVEIDDTKILKINRILHVELATGNTEPQSPEIASHTVEKTDNEAADRKKVIAELSELAKEKRESYELLRSYFGPTIPELKLFVIAESPRKQIEEGLYDDETLPPEVLAKIPESEIALLEIWENVHPETALGRRSFEDLSALVKNEEYQTEMTKFCHQAIQLLKEKRVLIDISFGGEGIPVITSEDTYRQVKTRDEVIELLNSPSPDELPYIRNTTYENGKLHFFDTYPVTFVDAHIPDQEIDEMIRGVDAGNFEGLKNIIDENPDLSERKLWVLSYLVLLKRSSNATLESTQ